MLKKLYTTGLQKRTLSAFILAPVVLWIIFKGSLPFLFLTVICAAICLYEWFQLSSKTEYKIQFFLIGLLYIILSFWCCYLLREAHSASVALTFVVLVWASDTGAYFTGKIIGGPKLAKKISPNKTWAGCGGAVILPGILAVIFSGALWTFLIGGIIGAVGQAGDLLISRFKRYVRVKDTGDIIPGHGGLLDRVDAMLLAAPVFLLIVSKFSYVF